MRGIRNRWKVGDYLIVDDESGHTHYASETIERWDGIIFRKRGNEDEVHQHPQLFVRAKDDPRALEDVRPQIRSSAAFFIDVDVVQGVKKPAPGPADHLYLTSDDGIGNMVIEGTPAFTVRED